MVKSAGDGQNRISFLCGSKVDRPAALGVGDYDRSLRDKTLFLGLESERVANSFECDRGSPLDSPTRENIAREFQGLRDWTEDGHTVLPERILNLIATRIDEQMASCEKAPNRSMIGRAYWIASKSASCYFQVATYACGVLTGIAVVFSVSLFSIFAAAIVLLMVLCSFVDGAANKRIRKLDESMWEEFKERLVREGFVPADLGSIEGPSPMDKS